MSEREMLRRLLSEDEERSQDEPAIAASIGEQMLHMNLIPLPRSLRARIRDACSRTPTRNAILIGGGIGHLAAWMLDLWCGPPDVSGLGTGHRPITFRIVEPGTRFGVVIDRLIRRHEAESWTQVIPLPWLEVSAEAASWKAASAALPEAAQQTLLPMPPDLVVIDLPEEDRATSAASAFEMIAPGGVVLVLEPEVPSGDVGTPQDGEEPTPAQSKVISFNSWIKLIKHVDENHALGFVELTGGTLVALLRTDSE